MRVESNPSAVAVGRAYPLAPRFLRECLKSPAMTRFLGPAHRTVRAVSPHTALGLVSRQRMRARQPPTILQPHEAQVLIQVPVAESPGPRPGTWCRRTRNVRSSSAV